MNGFCIATRASLVTSRALDTCPGASRPSGFAKRVSVSPSARAFAFIKPTKRGIEPSPTCAASAFAASFALWISAARSRSATVSRSPGGERDRRLTDGGCPLRDGDDLVELGVLERHEGGHQLRDRRDRQPLALVEAREHLARRGVLDDVGLGVHERRCGRAADRERQGERGCERDCEERDDPQGLQTAATLLDPDPLPDSQGDRIEVRDSASAGVRPSCRTGRRSSRACRRPRSSSSGATAAESSASWSSFAARSSWPASRAPFPQASAASSPERPERTSRTAIVTAARKTIGARNRAASPEPERWSRFTNRRPTRPRSGAARLRRLPPSASRSLHFGRRRSPSATRSRARSRGRS